LLIAQQTQAYVNQAMKDLYERLGDQANHIFKTITSDNGSEFAGIYELLKDSINVNFARPYAPHKSGAKENQPKLIRRFIPKSKP